jgi:cytochrome c
VFTATAGFRHGSIDEGVALVRELGRTNGFEVEHTEDAGVFTAERLADVDVLVFLNTTGDVLDVAQQDALEDFVRAGGGWVGVHSAADTEYDWPFYGELLGNGAWFRSHPPGTSSATLIVEPTARDHPSTAHLPATFSWEDEWYAFRRHPGDDVTILLRLDESTYDAGDSSMGSDHPISWARAVDEGRAWYTGVGHRPELFADPSYRAHLLGGLRWAAGDG